MDRRCSRFDYMYDELNKDVLGYYGDEASYDAEYRSTCAKRDELQSFYDEPVVSACGCAFLTGLSAQRRVQRISGNVRWIRAYAESVTHAMQDGGYRTETCSANAICAGSVFGDKTGQDAALRYV